MAEASEPLLRKQKNMGKESDEVASQEAPADYGSAQRQRSIGGVGSEELEGLTLYEKKCTIVNHEIDTNGMGRYQWQIWLLCGFGYMLDLLWAQAFGLVLSPLQQEFGFGLNESGNISVAFSAGLTAGAAFWGILVDIVGRRWAFNLTCLFSSAFGIALGGCSTYKAFLVCTAFTGFGIGGNIPIDTMICLEFIPQNKRFLLALLSIFQPIGVVITCCIAYGFIPKYSCSPNFSKSDPLPSCNNVAAGQACCTKASNYGWRYTLFTLGAITLFVFILRFFVFRFRESPKFLIYRGHDDKAIEVLKQVAMVNKRECGVTESDFDSLIDESEPLSITDRLGGGKAQQQSTTKEKILIELSRYKLLFKDVPTAWLTTLVWLTYICDFWGFTLAGTYLPTILARKNGDLDLGLKFTYRSYIAIYAPGTVGVVLGAMMYRVPQLGRKWTMVISFALMGMSIFLFSSVNNESSNIGFNVMEYFFQSMANAVLYGWTPEVFPAPIRGTACGFSSFWGRLFSIIAPLTAQSILPADGSDADAAAFEKVLYLAGGITLGCVITTALLPNKLGKQSY